MRDGDWMVRDGLPAPLRVLSFQHRAGARAPLLSITPDGNNKATIGWPGHEFGTGAYIPWPSRWWRARSVFFKRENRDAAVCRWGDSELPPVVMGGGRG